MRGIRHRRSLALTTIKALVGHGICVRLCRPVLISVHVAIIEHLTDDIGTVEHGLCTARDRGLRNIGHNVATAVLHIGAVGHLPLFAHHTCIKCDGHGLARCQCHIFPTQLTPRRYWRRRRRPVIPRSAGCIDHTSRHIVDNGQVVLDRIEPVFKHQRIGDGIAQRHTLWCGGFDRDDVRLCAFDHAHKRADTRNKQIGFRNNRIGPRREIAATCVIGHGQYNRSRLTWNKADITRRHRNIGHTIIAGVRTTRAIET